MVRGFILAAALFVRWAAIGAEQPRAAELAAGLSQLSLNPAETYRVRDLELNRGDVKFYLTEGILSFFSPLNGRVVGALFTTENVESGDGEVLALPSERSERASLASFTQRPNLNEHLRAAIFFFSDNTAGELIREIKVRNIPSAPDLIDQLNAQFGRATRNLTGGIDLRILQSLADARPPGDGFFYAGLFGRTIPSFSMFYDPQTLEPVTFGQGATVGDAENFQVWAAYRSRRAPAFVPPPNRFSHYRLQTDIRPDLTLQSAADFDYRSEVADGRVLRFEMSDRLRVVDAMIDGVTVEVFQRPAVAAANANSGGAFLLITRAPLVPGDHHVTVRYGGGVIRQTASGTFFVDDRTSWFPYSASLSSTFDLIFHCPERLRLVSTGELISEEVKNGVRIVHRQNEEARPFAGFNLGRYSLLSHNGAKYRVEVYSDKEAGTPVADIPQQTERILDFYTQLWGVQPLHSLAVSPIAGYFGQGFPGLVYLSDAAYLRPENRAPALRTERFDTFLNRLLLPHEVAHQWWGNVVTSSTYRSGWLVEALANYSALQYLEATEAGGSARSILAQYRTDLLASSGGEKVEATGPLDWGSRLLNTRNPAAWQPIVYGKGVWVLHMLRQRLGDKAFNEFERQLLVEFRSRTFTNEDVAAVAAKLLPAGQFRDRDPGLKHFFDTWILNTGIPQLSLKREGRDWLLDVEGVDESFSVDVPIRCGRAEFELRATKGENYLPRAARQSNTCSLPDNNTFLYTK